MPADTAPSPITAMTLRSSFFWSRATAMPSADEIEVGEWAGPNGPYSLAPRRLGEPARAAARGRRAEGAAAAGDDFVRIGLVADVQAQPVTRGVEHVVQRNSELDHAKAGAEVPAGHRDGINHLLAQLIG